MKENDLNTVLHFHDTFFKLSETFIRRQIASHVRFKPICLCFNLINRNLLPRNVKVYIAPRSPIDRLRLVSSLFSENFSKLLASIPSSYEHYTKEFAGKIDIIQTHFGNNLFYSVRLKKQLKIPLSVFFYGSDVTVLTKRYPKIYNSVKNYIDVAFTPSQFLKSKLENLELNVPIQVNRLGIDLSEWPYREHIGYEVKGIIKIVNVGRLVEVKGHEYLIGAHKILKNKGYKVETIIIGDGPRRKLLEYLISRLGLSREIKLRKNFSEKEVKTHLYSADFFVFPSVICKDGSTDTLGYACVEAIAAGLPVVASNVGGIPEYIINNETGLLVEPRNPKQIAEAIEELINNPEKARYLSNKGRQLIESEFNIKENMKKLELEYLKYISSH